MENVNFPSYGVRIRHVVDATPSRENPAAVLALVTSAGLSSLFIFPTRTVCKYLWSVHRPLLSRLTDEDGRVATAGDPRLGEGAAGDPRPGGRSCQINLYMGKRCQLIIINKWTPCMMDREMCSLLARLS